VSIGVSCTESKRPCSSVESAVLSFVPAADALCLRGGFCRVRARPRQIRARCLKRGLGCGAVVRRRVALVRSPPVGAFPMAGARSEPWGCYETIEAGSAASTTRWSGCPDLLRPRSHIGQVFLEKARWRALGRVPTCEGTMLWG
jgi:hypothetical protein